MSSKNEEPKDRAAEDEAEKIVEPAASENPDSPDEVGSEIELLKNKIAELEDLRLRMAAENQNTRKRLVKQQQDAFTYRHQDILRDLVEVIDNFERAIDSSAESRDFDTFHEGILMIEKQFSGMLVEKYNLERIGEEGEPFDPAMHEAMMMEESSEAETDTVKQVYQAGYRLHDRILRPAKVVVARPPQGTIADTDETTEDTTKEGAE